MNAFNATGAAVPGAANIAVWGSKAETAAPKAPAMAPAGSGSAQDMILVSLRAVLVLHLFV